MNFVAEGTIGRKAQFINDMDTTSDNAGWEVSSSLLEKKFEKCEWNCDMKKDEINRSPCRFPPLFFFSELA